MSLDRWSKNEAVKAKQKGGSVPQITLAAAESLAMPLVQEIVILADFRCATCQQRVEEIMSKMNGETESVVISMLEKKVTLTFTGRTYDKLPGKQVASIYCSSLNKESLIKKLFLSMCSLTMLTKR